MTNELREAIIYANIILDAHNRPIRSHESLISRQFLALVEHLGIDPTAEPHHRALMDAARAQPE